MQKAIDQARKALDSSETPVGCVFVLPSTAPLFVELRRFVFFLF